MQRTTRAMLSRRTREMGYHTLLWGLDTSLEEAAEDATIVFETARGLCHGY